MRVIPEVNEIVELEESILIMKQIAKLEHRIEMGGTGKSNNNLDVCFF